jgi:hypothetical protein
MTKRIYNFSYRWMLVPVAIYMSVRVGGFASGFMLGVVFTDAGFALIRWMMDRKGDRA